jgi:hypothetical protein
MRGQRVVVAGPLRSVQKKFWNGWTVSIKEVTLMSNRIPSRSMQCLTHGQGRGTEWPPIERNKFLIIWTLYIEPATEA